MKKEKNKSPLGGIMDISEIIRQAESSAKYTKEISDRCFFNNVGDREHVLFRVHREMIFLIEMLDLAKEEIEWLEKDIEELRDEERRSKKTSADS